MILFVLSNDVAHGWGTFGMASLRQPWTAVQVWVASPKGCCCGRWQMQWIYWSPADTSCRTGCHRLWRQPRHAMTGCRINWDKLRQTIGDSPGFQRSRQDLVVDDLLSWPNRCSGSSRAPGAIQSAAFLGAVLAGRDRTARSAPFLLPQGVCFPLSVSVIIYYHLLSSIIIYHDISWYFMIFHDISWYFSDRLRWRSESSVHPILVSWGMISFGSSGCCCTWPMLTCWLCWRGFEVPWGPMACWSSRRIACWKATPQGALSRFRVGDLRLKAGWYRWIKWLCVHLTPWPSFPYLSHIVTHTQASSFASFSSHRSCFPRSLSKEV